MNPDLYQLLFIGLGLLAASAVVSPLVADKRRLAGTVNFLLTAAAGAAFLLMSARSFSGGAGHAARTVTAGPVSIPFLVDGFSGFFVGIISLMATLSAFYSIRYMDHYREYKLRGYYLCFPLFILGMVGVVTVDDLSAGFSVAWQVMTLASYFLIRFEHRVKGNVRNANKYLVLMEFAWLLILAAAFLVNGASVGDSLPVLAGKLAATKGSSQLLIYGLLLVGFGFKAGMFPFGQLWLPDAHSIAPSPISALLSGVMIKTGVFGLIRTFFWMVPAEGYRGLLWGTVIASFGAVTLFIGTVQALKQHDAKRLHAYHSIGQMGYILLGTGSALVMLNSGDPAVILLSVVAIVGALYHTLNHTVFKGLLFLSTGSVLYATGTKDLNKLGGLMKLMPATAAAAGVASLSIAGMPVFSGFASKWAIISSDILAGHRIVYLVLFGIVALFTSAVTLASYVKFFGMTFASSGVEWNARGPVHEVPATMLIPKVILAVLCLVQGLFPAFFFQAFIGIFKNADGSILQPVFADAAADGLVVRSTMGVTVTVPGLGGAVSAVAVPLVILAVLAAGFLFAGLLKRSGGSRSKDVPTWLCGYQDLNDQTRYKASHLYGAFKKALRWTGGNAKNTKTH